MDEHALATTRRQHRWRYAVAWLLALLCSQTQAEQAMRGAWLPLHDDSTPAAAMAAYRHGDFQRFDPSQLTRLPADGSWIVLTAEPPWVGSERQLSIYPPTAGDVTLYDADGTGRVPPSDGHGRLSFRLDADLPASQPMLLRFAPFRANAPVSFTLQDRDEYEHDDARRLALASACLATMLAMALMAAYFALVLSDRTLVWYVGHVVCAALLHGIRTGYVVDPLGWPPSMAASLGGMAAALSMMFAALFAARFCQLKRYATWLHPVVFALALGMGTIALLLVSRLPLLEDVALALLEPLRLVCAAFLLLTSVVAWIRGARHAWFFLLGWTPWLVITALRSSQAGGALPHAIWLGDASLAASAFQAVALSLGLADRALHARRDRDVVQELADYDALTKILNRRAWTERAQAQFVTGPCQPLALLFMDLDNFKTLNDRLGHAAGDRALIAVAAALRQELRPGDLLGRYGGEEFVAVLRCIDQNHAMQVATRLCRRVNRLELPVDGKGLMLSISIGVAIRMPEDTIASLTERADQAMYTAKLNGRNRVQLEGRFKHEVERRGVSTEAHRRRD